MGDVSFFKEQVRRDQRTRQRRYIARSRGQAGLCTTCKQPVVRGTTLCKEHYGPYKSEAKAEYMRGYSARRKASGMCGHCRNKARPGRTTCAECARRESSKTSDLIRSRRLRAVQFLGNKCKDCGFTSEFPSVFDFDHTDATQKIGDISSMCASAGWARIEAELQKCDLVCANCHRIRTAKRYME